MSARRHALPFRPSRSRAVPVRIFGFAIHSRDPRLGLKLKLSAAIFAAAATLILYMGVASLATQPAHAAPKIEDLGGDDSAIGPDAKCKSACDNAQLKKKITGSVVDGMCSAQNRCTCQVLASAPKKGVAPSEPTSQVLSYFETGEDPCKTSILDARKKHLPACSNACKGSSARVELSGSKVFCECSGVIQTCKELTFPTGFKEAPLASCGIKGPTSTAINPNSDKDEEEKPAATDKPAPAWKVSKEQAEKYLQEAETLSAKAKSAQLEANQLFEQGKLNEARNKLSEASELTKKSDAAASKAIAEANKLGEASPGRAKILAKATEIKDTNENLGNAQSSVDKKIQAKMDQNNAGDVEAGKDKGKVGLNGAGGTGNGANGGGNTAGGGDLVNDKQAPLNPPPGFKSGDGHYEKTVVGDCYSSEESPTPDCSKQQTKWSWVKNDPNANSKKEFYSPGDSRETETGASTISGSGDSCGATVNLQLMKEVTHKEKGLKNRQDIVNYINDPKNEWVAKRQLELESQYGCDSAKSSLRTTDALAMFTNVGLTTAAGVSAGIATAKVQNTATQNPQDSVAVQRSAYESMAEAQRKTAYAQMAGAALQVVAAGRYYDVTKDQEEAAEKRKDAKTETGVQSDTLGKNGKPQNLNLGGLAHSVTSSEAATAQTENAKGQKAVMEASSEHQKISDQASEKRWLTILQAAATGVGAALNLMSANDLEDRAKNLSDPAAQPIAPTLVGGPQVTQDSSSPPPVIGPTGSSNEAAALASDPSGEQLGATPPSIAPPFSGGSGNPGGLKDSPLAASHDKVGPGSMSGGGGGGGLGGGGGGSGGSSDHASPEKSPDSYASGPSKYETASGAGGGYAANAGATAKDKSTGMDLNGLLGALMPKPGDDKAGAGPQGSILNFDPKSRSIASADAHDDGSILGRNSNLFGRVSTTTMSHFKKGNLK